VNWIQPAGCYENYNEPSFSIKGEKLLEKMSDNQLLKNNSTPWN
jgi:hypothetical protein